jgi:hypothetical protein
LLLTRGGIITDKAPIEPVHRRIRDRAFRILAFDAPAFVIG